MSGQPHLIYVHGFNSSPQSHKAQILTAAAEAAGLGDYFHVPELPFSPRKCMAILEEKLAELGVGNVSLLGSSMGGFYSINLANKYDIKAVLVNPAIDPHLLFKDVPVELKNEYTGEQYEFTGADVKALKEFGLSSIEKPDRFLTLLQTADETLDYRLAEQRLMGSSMSIQQGGSHGFDHFEDFIPQVFRFTGFSPV